MKKGDIILRKCSIAESKEFKVIDWINRYVHVIIKFISLVYVLLKNQNKQTTKPSGKLLPTQFLNIDLVSFDI